MEPFTTHTGTVTAASDWDEPVELTAATLLLLFTLTSMPAKAQFGGFGGGGGGEDMMTQMAPMPEMMKAKDQE